MVAVDAHYRFISVDVMSLCRFSDINIFFGSSLGQKLLNGSYHLPQPKSVPHLNEETPFVFLGEEAFPLMPNLIRPFPKVDITSNFGNKVFNYRLSQAHQSIECAFGILSDRSRVFIIPSECKLKTIENVVLAMTVFHNYLKSKTLSNKSQWGRR